MNGIVLIDKAGRIVIPKPARDALGIVAGDTLELVADSDRLTLRPVRHEFPLVKERGVWVYRSGGVLSQKEADEALKRTRREKNFL